MESLKWISFLASEQAPGAYLLGMLCLHRWDAEHLSSPHLPGQGTVQGEPVSAVIV